jgi:diacylglycerol kinase
VLSTALWLGIWRTKLALPVLAIVGVWVAGAFNTVIEVLSGIVVGDQYLEPVKRAKDVAATALC